MHTRIPENLKTGVYSTIVGFVPFFSARGKDSFLANSEPFFSLRWKPESVTVIFLARFAPNVEFLSTHYNLEV